MFHRKKFISSTSGSLSSAYIAHPPPSHIGSHGKGRRVFAFWNVFGFVVLVVLVVVYRFESHITPDLLPRQHRDRDISDTGRKTSNATVVQSTSARVPVVIPIDKMNRIDDHRVMDKDDATAKTPTDSPSAIKTKPIVLSIRTSIVAPRTNAMLDQGKISNEPWHIILAHEPRFDLLGSFVLPTLFLYAVTQYHNYTLQILPFAGSPQQALLKRLVNLKGNVTKDWGSGFQDASHRTDYDPVALNELSYQTMGFFPDVPTDKNIRIIHPWIKRDRIPLPGEELNKVCEETYNLTTSSVIKTDPTKKECYLLLSDNPHRISAYMQKLHGNMDAFFNPTFCQQLRTDFLMKNQGRLQQYNISSRTIDTDVVVVENEDFNVAVHIRRGDILHPDRWIDQQVFANVAKYICQTNTVKNVRIRTNIHVFSSGPNRDGNWSIMEHLAQPTTGSTSTTTIGDGNTTTTTMTVPSTCASVVLHIDEIEFDSWTFMIAADALVISTSTFSYIPALIRYDNVYFPAKFWHPTLSSFYIFDDVTGAVVPPTTTSELSPR